MRVVRALKVMAKTAAVPLIYRYPPTGLQPERLAIYLKALVDRAGLDGDVAEVGCNLGGTSVLGYKAISRAGWELPGGWKGKYICYDTFGGFVPEQFASDVRRGTTIDRLTMFSVNSDRLVRKILNYHDCQAVQLVKGDITKISADNLSKAYSVVLIDIDLADPTYEALRIFYPRLVEGGLILIDDCPEGYNWKAREGYQRFVSEMRLPEEYQHGLGVVAKGELSAIMNP